MSSLVSLRLPDSILDPLNEMAKMSERPRTFFIKKALKKYIKESADYQLALDRLREVEDKAITSDKMRRRLGV